MDEQRLGLAGEMKGFVPVAGTADQAQAAPRHSPCARQKSDDRLIGLPAFRRGTYGHPQRHAAICLGAQSLDGITPRARMSEDTDADAIGGDAKRRGLNRRSIQTADCG